MRYSIILAGILILQSAFATTETLYNSRAYSGSGLQKVQQYSDHYQQLLGDVTKINMMEIRTSAIDKINASGVFGRSAIDKLDSEIQANLLVYFQDHPGVLTGDSMPIINYAKAQFFLGDSIDRTNLQAKAKFYESCYSITDLSLRATGFTKWHKMDDSMIKHFNNFDSVKNAQIAQMIFLRTSCLGSWVTSGIISLLEGASRIAELIDSAKLVIQSNYTTAGHFGLHRVWAKIATNSPMKMFGKDLAKGVELMTEAFNKTRRGHGISTFGWNNCFYADSLTVLAASELRSGKRELKKGLNKINDGKTKAGIALVLSGQSKIKSAEDRTRLARNILEQFIAADLKTLNPANIVENQRAQKEAQKTLEVMKN